MKKTCITGYYICLLLVIAFQVLMTVFQGSLLVHQGYKIAQLSDTQTELKKQKEALELQIYTNQAIEGIDQSTLTATYEPVTSVIAISDQTTQVADSSL